jgi:hypothetical protein
LQEEQVAGLDERRGVAVAKPGEGVAEDRGALLVIQAVLAVALAFGVQLHDEMTAENGAIHAIGMPGSQLIKLFAEDALVDAAVKL